MDAALALALVPLLEVFSAYQGVASARA